MTKMKFAALALAFTAISAGSYAQTADEILQKHIDAIGGKAWDKVNTLKLVGSMNSSGFELGMTQTTVVNKGTRIDISAMGQNGYIIMTPTEGWTFMPFAGQTKPEKSSEEQVKQTADQINVKNTYLADKSFVVKAELDGMDTIENVNCYKLKITGKDGNERICYIEEKTYNMVRAEAKAKVGDEEQEAAVTFGNFKKLPEGITIPMTMGTQQGDLVFKTAEINKPVDEKIFKPTAAEIAGKATELEAPKPAAAPAGKPAPKKK